MTWDTESERLSVELAWIRVMLVIIIESESFAHLPPGTMPTSGKYLFPSVDQIVRFVK